MVHLPEVLWLVWEQLREHTVHLPVEADQLWLTVEPQVEHFPAVVWEVWEQVMPHLEQVPEDQLWVQPLPQTVQTPFE